MRTITLPLSSDWSKPFMDVFFAFYGLPPTTTFGEHISTIKVGTAATRQPITSYFTSYKKVKTGGVFNIPDMCHLITKKTPTTNSTDNITLTLPSVNCGTELTCDTKIMIDGNSSLDDISKGYVDNLNATFQDSAFTPHGISYTENPEGIDYEELRDRGYSQIRNHGRPVILLKKKKEEEYKFYGNEESTNACPKTCDEFLKDNLLVLANFMNIDIKDEATDTYLPQPYMTLLPNFINDFDGVIVPAVVGGNQQQVEQNPALLTYDAIFTLPPYLEYILFGGWDNFSCLPHNIFEKVITFDGEYRIEDSVIYTPNFIRNTAAVELRCKR